MNDKKSIFNFDDDDDFKVNKKDSEEDEDEDKSFIGDSEDGDESFRINNSNNNSSTIVSSPILNYNSGDDDSDNSDDNGDDVDQGSGDDRDPSYDGISSSEDDLVFNKALITSNDDITFQDYSDDDRDDDENDISDSEVLNQDDSQLLLTNQSFSEDTVIDTYKNIYESVRLNLNLSTIPSELPGREKERKRITKFLETTLHANQGGGSLYVAGMPGTGKTATVKEVIRNLKTKTKARELTEFQFIEINCMDLQDPHHIYMQLYKKMFNRRAKGNIKYQGALAAIERSMVSPNKKIFRVLLVDEFDMLVTKKQTVIYHLFEWANRENCKFIIIAIANTMNLHEKLLPRVKSRMNIQKVLFAPYTVDQLATIIRTRLVGLEAFDQDSIEICAIRVASVCGDARRALEMCRQAATIANQEYKDLVLSGSDLPPGKITVDHIDKVFKMISTSIKSMVDQCTFYEKLFLSCAVNILFISGISEVSYGTVYNRFILKCSLFSLYTPNIQEIQVIRSNLLNCRLILWSSKQQSTSLIDMERMIRLNLPLDDILYYFDNDPNSKYFSR